MRFISRAAVVALLAGAACALGACAGQQGMIRADAIADSVEKVVTRHNALVEADATFTDLEKRTFTRTANLLQEIVREAQKGNTVIPASKPTAEDIGNDGNNSTRSTAPPDTESIQRAV